VGQHLVIYWVQLSWFTLQLILDIVGSGFHYQGSLICPSCGQLCFVGNIYCAIIIHLHQYHYHQSKN